MPTFIGYISLGKKEHYYGAKKKFDDGFTKAQIILKIAKWKKQGKSLWFRSEENDHWEKICAHYFPATRNRYEEYIKNTHS